MYGTCETLCRELAAKYPGDAPLMLVIWSPEEIQALADGMDISLSDHEIRTVLARLEDIPEDQRIESGISSGVAMEIINNVRENRQVTVPAELLAHLPVSAEPAGAVSGCRYGPMRENPWLAATVPVAPPLSRRGLRSRHPGKRPPGCKGQRRFANRASRRCGGFLPVVVSVAIHLFKPLSPGADTATTCRTDCPG